MNDNIEPIYDFGNLRRFLTNMGYKVGIANGYREIVPEEVTFETISNGQLDIQQNGIYVVTPNGGKIQVFLYKRFYHLERYGKPRFHLCRCTTIDSFIESGSFHHHYVRANTDPVPVNDMDNGNTEILVSNLPLCKLCCGMMVGNNVHNSAEFVELLRQVRGAAEITEVDILGYTRDWHQVSEEYKESMQYTCEKCGLRIDNLFDREYIHCHHINGNKTDNRKENLQCLCIRCHSQVDEHHRRMLLSGGNKVNLDAFNNKYPV